MTPKGAAVLPRPFCCHFAFCRGRFAALFAFCRGRFAALFLLFSFPLSPSSCSPRPATFCELLPAPMVTFCELLPVPPRGQSLHFANFCLRPVLAKLAFCQLLATLCALAARFLSPSVPISAVFPFFLQMSRFFLQKPPPFAFFRKGTGEGVPQRPFPSKYKIMKFYFISLKQNL